MTLFFIHARNMTYNAHDDGDEYDNPEAALALGVRGAVALLTEDVNRGERSAAVEISIEREDGTQVLRSIVAVSVSPLSLADLSPRAAVSHGSRGSPGL